MEKFYLPYPLLPSEIILNGAQETLFYCYGRYCNTSEDITTQLLILYYKKWWWQHTMKMNQS